MHHQHQHQQQDSSLESDPQLPAIRIHHPASPRHHSSGVGATPTPTAGARRKIGVAVDLSDESAYAVRWAVHHYLRPGDAVILLHVSPTSVLFGADWGSIDLSISPSDFDRHPDEVTATATTTSSSSSNNQKKLEDDFDAFTASKAADLERPLKEAQIPYKIHIVKDHDMKESLEVERLGLSASHDEFLTTVGLDNDLSKCASPCAAPPVWSKLKPESPLKYLELEEMAEPLIEDDASSWKHELSGMPASPPPFKTPRSLNHFTPWKDCDFINFKLMENPEVTKN